jgi:hypothetical protein
MDGSEVSEKSRREMREKMERDPRLRPDFFWEQSQEMREKILYEDLIIARRERDVIRHYALVAFVSGLVAMFVATVIMIVIFAGGQGNDRQRQYELCLSGNRTRGSIQAVLTSLTDRLDTVAIQRRFPLLDCTPVKEGDQAITLIFDEQRKFVAYVLKNDEPPKVRHGRVLNEPEMSPGNFAPSSNATDK